VSPSPRCVVRTSHWAYCMSTINSDEHSAKRYVRSER